MGGESLSSGGGALSPSWLSSRAEVPEGRYVAISRASTPPAARTKSWRRISCADRQSGARHSSAIAIPPDSKLVRRFSVTLFVRAHRVNTVKIGTGTSDGRVAPDVPSRRTPASTFADLAARHPRRLIAQWRYRTERHRRLGSATRRISAPGYSGVTAHLRPSAGKVAA